MFGLMRQRSCALDADEKHRRRLHYCGTCKTMGRLYGQRTRLMLNHDAVFAAELLTAISGSGDVRAWDRSFQSHNCFALPSGGAGIPAALEYAATMTVFWAEVKVEDEIADSRRLPWAVARRALSKSFRNAAKRLEGWGVPTADLWNWVREQNRREARATSRGGSSPDGVLSWVSEATAESTAIAFAHGARVAGAPELAEKAGALGSAFGELVYLLDALEDYEKDVRSGQFNAVRAAYGLDGDRLPVSVRREVEGRLRTLQSSVEAALRALPLPPERFELFRARLDENLGRALGAKLPVLRHARDAAGSCARTTFGDRRRHAASLARSIAARDAETRQAAFARIRVPFIYATVATAAFLFPHQTASATTARECAEAGLSLPALGSALAALAVLPARFGVPVPPVVGRKRRKLSQICGCNTCCGKDDCDCCCDCECCCDACDCLDGCGSCGSCCECGGCCEGGCCDCGDCCGGSSCDCDC